MPQYSEQWSVIINRKEFILNEVEKSKLELAMKNGERWFKTERGDVLSVSHIESVVLNDRRIKNRLEEGKKQEEEVNPEKVEEIKEKIREKIKTF